MSFLLIQVIGLIALILSVVTYQLNKRTSMLITDTSAAFLYAVHFFLLGAATGGIMNLIGGIRGIIYYKYPPQRTRKWILGLFILISTASTFFFWDGWISTFALVGTLSYAIAFWQSDPGLIRRFLMISYPTWFVYNFAVGSYPGMAIEIILLVSNLSGQYRFDYKRVSEITE